MKKPRAQELLGRREVPWTAEQFLAKYPTLLDHLKSPKYDDGTARQTSTLMIFCENESLKICLNDRDNGRSVFVCGANICEALQSLEDGLCGDSLEWRIKGAKPNSQGWTPF